MRRSLAAIAALLMFASGASATPAASSMPVREQVLRDQLDAIGNLAEQGDLQAALRAADAALAAAGEDSVAEAALLAMRVGLLTGLRRDAETVTATETMIAKGYIVDPQMLTTAADAAARTAQPLQVAAMLTVYARRFPQSVNSLRWEFVAAAMGELRSPDTPAALQSFALALFDAGYRCDSDLGGVRFMERQAMDGLVAGSRIAEARSRLADVTSIENLAGMAVDRRFEALWPTLEGLLGDHLVPATRRDLARIRQAFDADQDNLLIRQSYVRRLTWLGDPARAVALSEHILTNPAEIAAGGRYGWWLVVAHADALGVAGDPQGGLQRYRQLNAAIPRGNGVRIDALVDEATFAARAGLPLDAVQSADIALATDGVSGFGKMQLWQAKACALHRLGRDTETAPIIARIDADPMQNRDAYVDAMLCLGQLDRAEAVVLSSLGDPERRTDILLKLQQLVFDKHDRALAPAMAALASRPAVASAIIAYGRQLPQPLRPAY